MLDEAEAGIAVHVRHALADDVVDIGMYVDPALRRRGVGSSILALTARDVLSQGRTPVAGCWWKNWASRVTLETAGMTCAGHDLPAGAWIRTCPVESSETPWAVGGDEAGDALGLGDAEPSWR